MYIPNAHVKLIKSLLKPVSLLISFTRVLGICIYSVYILPGGGGLAYETHGDARRLA